MYIRHHKPMFFRSSSFYFLSFLNTKQYLH
nr:MAG TPA: hypothetical protein [Bacteriophage sp.]